MSKAKQKILVYGITGMLGTRIAQLLQDKFKIIGPPHSHLDITNRRKVHQNIKDVMPYQIIYAAGLTKVDFAQTHKRLAFRLNSQSVGFVCEKAAKLKIPVHYISTDAVFDGQQSKRPYNEDDPPNPVSIYGQSKLEGEKIVLSCSSKNSVVRTIMIFTSFYPHKKDFARLAYESLKNGENFEGITDQVINPIFVDDLVLAIAAILDQRANGIYHVAATDSATNYGFVEKIAKAFKFDKKLINKVKFDDFFKNKPAPRQQYSVLSTEKFRKEFGSSILHTIDGEITLFKKQISKLKDQPVDI